MAGGESDKPAKEKEAKAGSSAASTQEQPSTATNAAVNPDWSGFQAYSPMPPHGFLASSPQTHPYMWGVQQFMPPYGTPPHPYVAMYPHGGMYPHPSMPPGSYPFSPFAMPSPNGIAEASGNTPGSIEADGKPSDVKEKLPIKRSKGSYLEKWHDHDSGLGDYIVFVFAPVILDRHFNLAISMVSSTCT